MGVESQRVGKVFELCLSPVRTGQPKSTVEIVVNSPKEPVASGSVVTGIVSILTGMYRLFPYNVNR